MVTIYVYMPISKEKLKVWPENKIPACFFHGVKVNDRDFVPLYHVNLLFWYLLMRYISVSFHYGMSDFYVI